MLCHITYTQRIRVLRKLLWFFRLSGGHFRHCVTYTKCKHINITHTQCGCKIIAIDPNTVNILTSFLFTMPTESYCKYQKNLSNKHFVVFMLLKSESFVNAYVYMNVYVNSNCLCGRNKYVPASPLNICLIPGLELLPAIISQHSHSIPSHRCPMQGKFNLSSLKSLTLGSAQLKTSRPRN